MTQGDGDSKNIDGGDHRWFRGCARKKGLWQGTVGWWWWWWWWWRWRRRRRRRSR